MNALISSPAEDRQTATPSPRSGIGEATAKVILIGEHSVVYGFPALAVPVASMRVNAEVEESDTASRMRSSTYTGAVDRAPDRIRPTVTALEAALAAVGAADADVSVVIRSGVPLERGLGSSAAVAAAVVDAVAAAYGASLTDEERHELVQTAERAAHGSPSGLDARTVRAQAPVWFHDGSADALLVGAPLHLVIADSGVRGRTRHAVAEVARRRADDPTGVDEMLAGLGDLTVAAREAIGAGDGIAVGAVMDDAQRLLTALGVGHPALDHLAAAARGAGALGAKLTGGGQGGCLIALAPDEGAAERIATALRAAGAAEAWTTIVQATS